MGCDRIETMKALYIYGEIGWDVTAEGIRAQLEEMGAEEDVELRIHSRGGDVMEGLAIVTTLQRHEGRVTATVDGLAASMAAVIALAAERVTMAENAWLMFHEANASTCGAEADDLERMAAMLRAMNEGIVEALAGRTGEDPEAIRAELKGEMWLTGKQALARGIIHETTKAVAMAAAVPAGAFAHVPEVLRARVDNGGGAMNEKFSWVDRLAGKPEKELAAVKAEKEKGEAAREERIERIEQLLSTGGPIAAMSQEVERIGVEVANQLKALGSFVALAEDLQEKFQAAVDAKAAQKAIDIAAAQGAVLREPVVVAALEPAAPEAPKSAREQWEAMPAGAEKRVFYAANKREILKDAGLFVGRN